MEKVSKQARLTEALIKGQKLTAAQIQARFRIANPTATISDIRSTGVSIVTDSKKNSRGETKTFYSIA
jgi:hypothetical protein